MSGVMSAQKSKNRGWGSPGLSCSMLYHSESVFSVFVTSTTYAKKIQKSVIIKPVILRKFDVLCLMAFPIHHSICKESPGGTVSLHLS
jgi:hypothetical protein